MTRRRRSAGGVDRLPSGRYRVRVIDPATGARLSLGTYPTKADADAAFASALHAQRTGSWLAPHTTTGTLGEYAAAWIDVRLTGRGEPLRPRTKEFYEGLLRLHVSPSLGDRTLHQLTTPLLRSWHRSLREGAGPKTAAKSYRFLRAVLNTAVDDRLLAHNPCTIKGAGIEVTEERSIPTVGQVYALADAIEPRFRVAVLLAAFGGRRRGEILALRRRDVSFLHRTVSVELQRQQSAHGVDLVGPPKTAAGRRTLVLPTEVLTELELHMRRYAGEGADGLVLTGAKGGFVRPHVLHKHWNEARITVGVPGVHFHDLRHLAATLAAGTKELMHRLGHVSPQAALRYQHATTARDSAIDRASDPLRRSPATAGTRS